MFSVVQPAIFDWWRHAHTHAHFDLLFFWVQKLGSDQGLCCFQQSQLFSTGSVTNTLTHASTCFFLGPKIGVGPGAVLSVVEPAIFNRLRHEHTHAHIDLLFLGPKIGVGPGAVLSVVGPTIFNRPHHKHTHARFDLLFWGQKLGSDQMQ